MYAEFASPNASQHSAKCEINLPEDKATGGWVHLRFLGGNVNSLGVWNVPPPPPPPPAGDAENQFRLQVFNKVKIMSPAKTLHSASPLSCGENR